MKPPLRLYDEGGSTTGYWRNYAFEAEPGSIWVQQVDTEVTCFTGDDPWIRFRDSYGEYFVLDAEGGLGGPGLERPWLDLHAFDVLQDGWGRSGLRDWLARQPDQIRRPPSRLTVRKRFRLGPGTLTDVELSERAESEGAFGYFAEDLLEPSGTWLEFCLAPQAKLALESSRVSGGSGQLCDPKFVWEAVESYAFSYPTLSGALRSASTYTQLVPEGASP